MLAMFSGFIKILAAQFSKFQNFKSTLNELKILQYVNNSYSLLV
jgi:hypothetical protein